MLKIENQKIKKKLKKQEIKIKVIKKTNEKGEQ